MKNALLIFILLCFSLNFFGKDETCYNSHINSTPEFLCDDYGRLSITVDHIQVGIFLINTSLDIREMYYSGHCCDYIVTDSSLIYRHSIIYWEDEWELDSEVIPDTIIEVKKYDLMCNILNEICNNLNINPGEITISDEHIDFLQYSEIFTKQLTESEELEKELIYAFQRRSDYGLSKYVATDKAHIPFDLPQKNDAPRFLFEFSDVISNMVCVRLSELNSNNSCKFLILLETDGSIKKIISENGENIMFIKHNHKGHQFKVSLCKQEFGSNIIGNEKIGYCIYDKSRTILFKINNIQNFSNSEMSKWRHKADYFSFRENDSILFYRTGILYYNDLSQINCSELDSIAVTVRKKSDIIKEMKSVLAKRLGVNTNTISLCDTVIQFKPEPLAEKLSAFKHIEKELLLTNTMTKNKRYRNYILLHNELNGVNEKQDIICYKIYYSEFINNMIYAEVKPLNMKDRIKVLFILDNRGYIEECITNLHTDGKS